MISLDPALAALLERARRVPLALNAIDWREPVEAVRRRFWTQMHAWESEGPALQEIRNLVVAGADGPLKARLYVPFAAGVTSPGLVFFHGGAFVMGDLESHEMLCRRLADAGRIRVLAVEYRLAPEHRWPAAPEDAMAATRWAIAHASEIAFDPARIGVGGDSAGGNLAAVVAQGLKRQDKLALAAQLLIYPCTQFLRMTPSQLRLQEGYVLTQAAQDFFMRQYIGDREAAYDWRASPLVSDDLAGLAPACVVTAGFDPLLDEGKVRCRGGDHQAVGAFVRGDGKRRRGRVATIARLLSDNVRKELSNARCEVGRSAVFHVEHTDGDLAADAAFIQIADHLHDGGDIGRGPADEQRVGVGLSGHRRRGLAGGLLAVVAF
jgi:acetyl esterase